MAETPYITKTRRPWAKAHHRLDVAAVVAVLLGIAALLLELGFYRLPLGLKPWMIDAVLVAVALALLAERIARWAMAPDRRAYARTHWVHAALPVAAVVVGLVWMGFPRGLLTAARLYLGGTIVVRGVSLYARAIGSGMHPARMLAGSFLFGIIVGTGLLMLPRAVPAGHAPLAPDDALFTATSATCVTGLIVLDTGTDFSRFGQTVILGLIQLGGLGLMTFGTIFMLLGRRALGLRHQIAMGEALADEAVGRVARTVTFVILLTVIAEAIGAVALHGLWAGRGDGWFFAVFHSISAFCNAGFSLQSDSFIPQRDTWQVLVAVPTLIIVGGLGFPVLMDVLTSGVHWVRYGWHRRRGRFGVLRPRWTLHTKIVLVTTLLLLVFGTAALVLCEQEYGGQRVGKAQRAERGEGWRSMSLNEQVRQAWFQAVTARTAGFNTIDLDELSPAGKLWIISLMAIGGSPASTAGGFKTVTLAVVLLVGWSVLRRRPHVEVFGRTLETPLLRRTVVLFILFLALVLGSTLLLAVVQGPRSSFVDVLFEAVSACGTVGLSLGETARLNDWPGKLVLVVAMYAGRVGPLTLLMSLTRGIGPARYQYPSENLVVG